MMSRRVPLAVTTGWNGPGLPSGLIRYLCGGYRVPVRRWRLHISNRHPRYGWSAGPFTLSSVRVGPGSDGHFTDTAATLIREPVRAEEDWTSGWLTLNLAAEHLIEVTFSASETYNMLAPSWRLHRDGMWEQLDHAPLWIWIEAEVSSDVPVVAVLGDSTGAGQGANLPLHESALAVAGRQKRFLPVFYAHSGDRLRENRSPDAYKYTRWEGFDRADAVIIQAGSNDLHMGEEVGSLQRSFVDVADAVRKRVSDRVWACTIKPRFPHSDIFEETRMLYNSWLMRVPRGVEDVIDAAACIGEAQTPMAFAADEGHLNTAGHAAMAAAFVEVGERLR